MGGRDDGLRSGTIMWCFVCGFGVGDGDGELLFLYPVAI